MKPKKQKKKKKKKRQVFNESLFDSFSALVRHWLNRGLDKIMQNCVFYRIYYQVSYPNPNQDSETNRIANIMPETDINTNN